MELLTQVAWPVIMQSISSCKYSVSSQNLIKIYLLLDMETYYYDNNLKISIGNYHNISHKI